MTLFEKNINESTEIDYLNILDKRLELRLKELGFVENTIVKILNISPLKKTILVELFGNVFALKSEIAKNIYLK